MSLQRHLSRAIVAVVCLTLFLGFSQVAQGCPSCQRALSDGSQGNLAAGIYYSILFMMSMPFAIIGSFGAAFTWDMAHTDQVSPDLELPKWIVYLCIPLGSYLMSFRFMQVAWAFFRTGELPKHDVMHVEGVDVSASAALHPLEGTTGARS